MLNINNLTVGYTAPILERISFSIQPGQVVCLMGRSGIGKTTLLNKIVANDFQITRPDSFSLVTQENLFLEWRNTLENVLLPLELKGWVTELDISKAKDLLRRVGLENSLEKLPSELSGGMKQRVSVARALLQDAKLYLFDEPLSAVDFDLRIILGTLIREFVVMKQRAALFVTHNLEEAISVADRILLLGGTPARITGDFKVPFSEVDRDPIKLRDKKEFAELFANLWRALGL